MAENEDGQEKTESPTGKRRQQARDEGQIARSVELSSAAVLLGGALSIAMSGGTTLANFTQRVLHESAGALSMDALTPAGGATIVRTVVLGLVGALLPFFAGVVVITVGVNLAQSRGAMSWAPLKPNFGKLNPASGLKRLVSLDALINLPKSLLKLAVLGIVTWLILRGSWPELVSLAETGPAAIMAVLKTLGLRLVFLTGLAFLVIALADYVYQVVRLEKSLKMTKQEVMLEHRESEGDPQIKGRIRQMQRQRSRQRMLQAVPRADVVITNPTHVAVALQYDPDISAAPIVLALGERKLAERIKEIARASGIPLIENKPVARALLATCVIGKPIPPGLYTAVAEILAFVYRLRNPRYGRDAAARSAA
jgi:flagellar biosynthetic protein FlhB